MTDNKATPVSRLAALRAAVRARFGVDSRALAAMRIGLGALLLADLGLRARDLTAFYTDAGVMPRATMARLYPTLRSVSIHAMSGDAWFQGMLFLLAAGFAVALMVGYRTRVATVASLVLLVSLHARNPLVLNAGDVLLRRLLFWSLFLPLGSHWAVDAIDGEGGDRTEWVAGLASAALLIQVVLVYATNLPFKLRTDVWLQGEAILYVVNLEEYTAGLGPVLAQYPGLLAVLTWAWFGLVAVSVLLVVLTGRARTVLASLFAGGHVGMALTMDLGIFPFVSLAALLPFVSPAVWDRVERTVGPVSARFDGLVSRPGPTLDIPFGRRARVARSVLLAALIASLLLVNGVATGVVDGPEAVPDAVEDRSWNMFGNPPQVDGWYAGNATVDDGRPITARIDAARLDRPPDAGARYPNARWRKYQGNLAAKSDDQLYANLVGDACRRWTTSGQAVERIRLEHVRERTNLSGADRTTTTAVGQYECHRTGENGA